MDIEACVERPAIPAGGPAIPESRPAIPAVRVVVADDSHCFYPGFMPLVTQVGSLVTGILGALLFHENVGKAAQASVIGGGIFGFTAMALAIPAWYKFDDLWAIAAYIVAMFGMAGGSAAVGGVIIGLNGVATFAQTALAFTMVSGGVLVCLLCFMCTCK